MAVRPREIDGRPWLRAVVALGILIAPPGLAAAQESKSASIAKDLVQTLDAAKLDGIAAADPGAPGTFIAALYIQGTELLVVSAKYAAPTLLADKLSKKEYREIYIDLSSASVAGSKIFIQDQGADGILAKPSGDSQADSWEQNNKTTTFEGAKKAKLSDEEYAKAFSDADERYAKMLTLLLAQAKAR
jgi:hypothetical protein